MANQRRTHENKFRTISFAGRAIYLYSIGCIMDIFSTFLPWSRVASRDMFLPFSFPFPAMWNAYFFPENLKFFTISIIIRVAAVSGLVGMFLLAQYGEKRKRLSYVILTSSLGLTVASAVLFLSMQLPLYVGSYMVILGATIKIISLLLENVEIQIENIKHG